MTKFRKFLAMLAVATILMSVAQAQQPATTTAYVNSQYLITLHPVYPQVQALQEQARAELGELQAQAQALFERSQSAEGLSPEDQEALNITMMTLESASQGFDQQLAGLVEPALVQITEAIATVAQSLGITMVFDYDRARESGLIVYADPASDLTSQVEAHMSGSN